MKPDTDVVIIGAGPAGLTAAKTLSESDIGFRLLSRETSPGETKVCGGFVTARALTRYGIRSIPGSYPVKAVRLKFPNSDIKTVDFESPVGVNVSRAALGKALLGLADMHQGNILLGAEARSVAISHDRCSVSYTDAKGDGRISSDIVIDASGVNAVTTKSGIFRPRIANDKMGYAVQYQMRRPPSMHRFPEMNSFLYGSFFSPGGYAWIFPRGNETVVGSGGLVTRVRQSEIRPVQYLNKVLNKEPMKSEHDGVEVTKTESALMPLAGIVKPSFTNRLMLAGDAAGHCSPISGEGIYYSMVGGETAGRAAAKAVKLNDFSANVLREHERDWVSLIGSDLKWWLWLQKRLLRTGSTGFGSKLFDSEKACRTTAEMLAGIRPVKDAILSVLPRYVVSKLQ